MQTILLVTEPKGFIHAITSTTVPQGHHLLARYKVKNAADARIMYYHELGWGVIPGVKQLDSECNTAGLAVQTITRIIDQINEDKLTNKQKQVLNDFYESLQEDVVEKNLTGQKRQRETANPNTNSTEKDPEPSKKKKKTEEVLSYFS